MILTEDYVSFLMKHDITPTQYLVLTLFYEKRFSLLNTYKKSLKSSLITEEELSNLIDRDLLIKEPKGYKLGKAFTEIFCTPDKAVDELYDLYPTFLTRNDGVTIPLSSMDRYTCRQLYIPAINGSVKEHKEVLKDIQYGIDNKLIAIGINKFITSHHWKALRKHRESQTTTKPTILDNNF